MMEISKGEKLFRVRNKFNGDEFLKSKDAHTSYIDSTHFTDVVTLDGKRVVRVRTDYLEKVRV